MNHQLLQQYQKLNIDLTQRACFFTKYLP